MTLILVDGFETYRTDSDKLVKWTGYSNGPLTNDAGYGGTQSLTGGVGTGSIYKRFVSDAHATVACGFACRAWTLQSTADLIVFYGDTGATTHVTLKVQGGAIYVYRGTSGAGTLLGQTATIFSSYAVNDWVYVEAKVVLNDTTGSVQIRVGGNGSVPVLNLTNVDTKNAGTNSTLDQVQFFWTNDNSARVDDFYIVNGAGSAPYNDFLGEVKCYALYPNGNGNSSQLVGSDADSTNNYLLVDETSAVAVSATDYVGSATDGQKDTYTFTDLVPTTGTVIGVTLGSYALKSDTGAKSFRPVVRSGTTDYAGTDQPLTTSLARYAQEYLTDPNTSAAWTIANVNAAQFGFEVRP